MMKNKLSLAGITLMAVFLFSCESSNNAVRQELVVDSCIVRIKQKKQEGSLVEYVISLDAKRNIPRADGTEMFAMEQKFELVTDSATVLPVFCQPLATGNSKKFLYMVSFEMSDGVVNKKGSSAMRILPNYIVRDTVYYKL